MENNKNSIVLTVIAVATLIVAVVGATFAYFQAQGGTAANATVTVQTGTAGLAAFKDFTDLTLSADQTTFAQNAGNITKSTTGTVSWQAPGAAGTSTPSATDRTFCYTVSLVIGANGFGYSVNTDTPELLFNITKAGSEITSGISGATYKSVTDGKSQSLSGWDITTLKNVTLNIPGTDGNKHTIIADAGVQKTESWTASVTLVNLGTDQSGTNAGKTMSATLKFAKCS